MDVSTFYWKQAGGHQTRVPPVKTDDSCLSDSEDSDKDYRPTPGDVSGDESSRNSDSDEDSDSNHDAPASTSATGARRQSAATARRRWQKVMWEMVQQQNSVKDILIWQGALPDANETRELILTLLDADLLDTIVQLSNLYCMQRNPNSGSK